MLVKRAHRLKLRNIFSSSFLTGFYLCFRTVESEAFTLSLTQNYSNCCIVCRNQTNEHILSLANEIKRKLKLKKRCKKIVLHQKLQSRQIFDKIMQK